MNLESITVNDILGYYKVSQTDTLRLDTNHMSLILKEGNFESYHPNIGLTIAVLLRIYRIEFEGNHVDYKKTTGGFSQMFSEYLDGGNYGFSFTPRKMMQVSDGFYIFEDVRAMYRYKPSYPNNIQSISVNEFIAFYTYILKSFHVYMRAKYREWEMNNSSYELEYETAKRHFYADMGYYLGKKTAHTLITQSNKI